MKKYKSGAEKRKENKRKEEICNQQKDSLLKFLTPTQDTSQPSTSLIKENENIENGIALFEYQRIEDITVPYARQNLEIIPKPIDELESESKSEDLKTFDVEADQLDFMNDIALWPKHLTDKTIEFVILNKPNNVGKIENLKSLYVDGAQTYYRGLHEDHFYRKVAGGKKK